MCVCVCVYTHIYTCVFVCAYVLFTYIWICTCEQHMLVEARVGMPDTLELEFLASANPLMCFQMLSHLPNPRVHSF